MILINDIALFALVGNFVVICIKLFSHNMLSLPLKMSIASSLIFVYINAFATKNNTRIYLLCWYCELQHTFDDSTKINHLTKIFVHSWNLEGWD